MTVLEIVRQYLIENNYDGLCNKDCGCGLDDIEPCCSMLSDCEPGKKIPDPDGEVEFIYVNDNLYDAYLLQISGDEELSK